MKEFANPAGRLLDLPTAAIIGLMVLGLPGVMWLYHQGLLPFIGALLVATMLMNLSFTAWHEASHATLSSQRAVNHALGVLASFASVYPGYFARRREHLIHHKWEGVPGKDPVYPRIQASFWSFPLKVAQVAIAGEPWDVPASFQPITRAQRVCDTMSNLLACAIIAAGCLHGYAASVLGLWVLPRALVLVLHAYYICFFPHVVPGGGFRLYRVRRPNLLLRLLTVEQTFHGLHHRWPFIPWHRYAAAQRRHADELAAEGIEVV